MLSAKEENLIIELGIEKYTDADNETMFVMKTGTVDADSEEPNCGRCDNFLCCNNKCDKCGPEYFWNNYRRTMYDILSEEDIHELYNRLIKRVENEH